MEAAASASTSHRGSDLPDMSIPPAIMLATDELFYKDFNSVHDMFPNTPPGLQMLNKIKTAFLQRTGVRVDFFNELGQAQVIPHDLNQRHQTVAVNTYVQSILKYGNCQDCRGGAAAILSQGGRPPWRLVAYASMTRAIMLAKEKYPHDTNVLATIKEGLVVDEYHYRTPTVVIIWLRDFFNLHGGGTGVNVHQVMSSTLKVEAEWLVYADQKKIKLSRCGKGPDSATARCWDWVKKKYPDFYRDAEQWVDTKAVMRFFRSMGWLEDIVNYVGDHCDFTSPDMSKDDTVVIVQYRYATIVVGPCLCFICCSFVVHLFICSLCGWTLLVWAAEYVTYRPLLLQVLLSTQARMTSSGIATPWLSASRSAQSSCRRTT